MQSKKITLLARIIALFMLFATLLCALICTVSYFSYRTSTLLHYSDYALNVGETAAAELNVEQLIAWAQSGKTDEEYFRVHQRLLSLRTSMKVAYIYVHMPISNDKLMFIFDAIDYEKENNGVIPLGSIDNYNDNFETAKKAMASGLAAAELDITKSRYGYLASAYVPLKDASGQAVAYVGVDIQMDDIVSFLRRHLLTIIVYTISMVLVCFAVLFLFVKRAVIAPIATIARKAESFTGDIEDEYFEPIAIKNNDEIGSLAQSVNRMFEDLQVYTHRLAEETAAKQRIDDDLKMAQNIQKSLLPMVFPPFMDYTDVEIVADIVPAKDVSGNFYDCFPINKHHLAFVVADVSGGGVGAALFMMVAHTLIKSHAVSGYSPREVLEAVNKQLCKRNNQNLTVAAFIGIYDSRSNILSYAGAGLPAPLLKRVPDGAQWLPVEASVPLAAAANTEYVTQVQTMEPGDCLLLYSAGVTSATNAAGSPFGAEMLMQLMKKVNTEALVPQEIVELLGSTLNSFTAGTEQANDMTLLLMRRL